MRKCHCGLPANSKGYCPKHRPVPVKGARTAKIKKPIKYKVNAKGIVQSDKYYFAAIEANQKANGGLCICEECHTIIHHPKGRNVSHIISKGSNKALYLDVANHCILCYMCEDWWTCGRGKLTRKDMKIWPKCERIIEELTLKYYSK